MPVSLVQALFRRRERRRLGLLLRLSLLILVGPVAAMAQPVLLVQNELADLHPDEVTGFDWKTAPGTELASRFCAAQTGTAARLVLASHRLTRRERDACSFAGSGKLVEALVGRRAVIAMTGGTIFSLTSRTLYQALARDVLGSDGKFSPNRATRWRELDGDLPDAPIRILLPPEHSAEDRILNEVILYEGCSTRAGATLPADSQKRLSICITLRTDAVVARATPKQTVAAWLRIQGNTAVALIGVATLLAEPELETALPLDGVTPSFTTIADQTYRASLPVWLLTVISPETAQAIAGVAGPLLAESSIGPLGKLPRRGLAPVTVADRVKLRATLGQLLNNLSN